jgi:hypothetical protein
MRPDLVPPLNPGDPLPGVRYWNELARQARTLGNPLDLGQALSAPVWALLAGAGPTYAWTEQVPSAGGWVTGGASGSDALEVNGWTGLAGKVVQLYPTAHDWRFQYVRLGSVCEVCGDCELPDCVKLTYDWLIHDSNTVPDRTNCRDATRTIELTKPATSGPNSCYRTGRFRPLDVRTTDSSGAQNIFALVAPAGFPPGCPPSGHISNSIGFNGAVLYLNWALWCEGGVFRMRHRVDIGLSPWIELTVDLELVSCLPLLLGNPTNAAATVYTRGVFGEVLPTPLLAGTPTTGCPCDTPSTSNSRWFGTWNYSVTACGGSEDP